MVGHPDRDGAAGVAQVPLQGRLLAADQRERPRPELLDERAGLGGTSVGQRVEGRGGADQHRRRHLAAAALGASSRVTASGSNASAATP